MRALLHPFPLYPPLTTQLLGLKSWPLGDTTERRQWWPPTNYADKAVTSVNVPDPVLLLFLTTCGCGYSP